MKKQIFSLICILISNTTLSFAQPGSLDLAFDTDGKATTGFQVHDISAANSVAIQADGKIIVAGYSDGGFALARYNANGTFDNSFGSNGKVTTNIGGARSVIIQPNGKIVAAGYFGSGTNNSFAVIRYNANGTRDNTFSEDGIVTTAIGGIDDEAYSIAMQSDGKIVVAGSARSSSTSTDFAIVRYNVNGSLDNTFGSNGIVTKDFGNSVDHAYSVAIQNDGKIIVAGYSATLLSGTDFALVRYNANGTIDNTFSLGGIILTDFNNSVAKAHSIVIQPDGKIVAAGVADDPVINKNFFALARYNSNGILDNTFSGDGKVITGTGNLGDQAFSVALQQDGKIVAAGMATMDDSKSAFALVRYKPNGTPDNTFSANGIVTAMTGDYSSATAVAIQPDGKIVTAGYFNEDFITVRYKTNGTPDNAFSLDGIVITDFGRTPTSDNAQAVAIQQDGKIVVAGYSTISGAPSRFAILRYNANGRLDNRFFDSEGKGTTGGDIDDDFAGYAIAIQPDGKILVAGRLYSNMGGPHYSFALVRYSSSGTLDHSFGSAGIVITAIGGSDDKAYSVAVQPDGKIIAAGYSYNGSDNDFAVVRYKANGSLDNTFSGDGMVTTNILGKSDYGRSVAIQSDGKIVVAGPSSNGSYTDFAVVRYNSNGTLDNTFSGDGKLTTDFAGKSDEARSVVIQANGKIVVAGYSANVSNTDIAIARYNTNGTLDNTFSGDGKELTNIETNAHDFATAAALQTDGKILVAGYSFNTTAYDYNFVVVRYTTSGIPDNTFGTANGKTLTDFGTTGDIASSMAIQADGKIVVAGATQGSSTGFDFAIARYNSDNTGNVATMNAENAAAKTPVLNTLSVYPNPLVSKTTVQVQLKEESDVTIELWDAAGRKIRTIQQGMLSAGSHVRELRKENLAAGIYFLQMLCSGQQVTTKIIVK